MFFVLRIYSKKVLKKPVIKELSINHELLISLKKLYLLLPLIFQEFEEWPNFIILLRLFYNKLINKKLQINIVSIFLQEK